jgi:CHAT domain-containing protein
MMTDIYGLKLRGMRLVTLSACDTAVGEREPGRNLTTLADAFGVAGSPTVIASLWKVSDASTRELMVAFYKGLKDKKSLAEALQGAQRSLIARPELRHPFYWAPFVLLGDWR